VYFIGNEILNNQRKMNYAKSSEKFDLCIYLRSKLENLMKTKGASWIDGTGEAAFYGPKIDFISHDSIGRVLQVATIQLDFNQPKNFGLVCTNEQGEKEQVVMIHAAIMGSIERFSSTLIEHLAGVFPTWLSPVQVSIVPVRENHNEKAREIYEAIKNEDIRVELEDDNNSLGKRINHAKAQKVPYIIVLGDKEIESGNITIESRTDKQEMTLKDFIAKLKTEIKNKTLN
jgi:threonyl-tRNA synthetase